MACKRRKIVLIIVEGPSEETALEQPFMALFNPEDVMIEVVHGDITAEIGSGPSTIVSSIGNLVKGWASKYGLKREDILRVIHITDTDGTYIPDANVIEDTNHNGCPEYTETNIVASPESKVRERNARKSANLNRLSSIATVWGKIPYSIHYMSCNLDHVLYGVQNSDDATKRHNAFLFAKTYKDDLDGFVKCISEPAIAVSGNYRETWEYIRQGLNSLHRYTNLSLCFQSRLTLRSPSHLSEEQSN